MPTVSVLMATYNTPDEWLKESIKSILDQTYTDFEFIIVDDCSTTDLASVKAEMADPRIVWIRNEENLGLTKSLNVALAIAKGKYIARMDADDIALPERFAEQVKFMDEHPEVIVCGSYRRAFGLEEKDEIWNIPTGREMQQIQLLFFNCGLTHPTAMFRKSMLDEYGIRYNDSYRKAQDYGIWVQCTRYAPMAVIPKVLLKYRKSDQQISSAAGKKDQNRYAVQVRADQLRAMGIVDVSESNMHLHECLCNSEYVHDISILEPWVERLLKVNLQTQYFEASKFNFALRDRWFRYCYKYARKSENRTIRKVYWRSFKIQYFFLYSKERIGAIFFAIKGRVANAIKN